jgi:hypothetical protein
LPFEPKILLKCSVLVLGRIDDGYKSSFSLNHKFNHYDRRTNTAWLKAENLKVTLGGPGIRLRVRAVLHGEVGLRVVGLAPTMFNPIVGYSEGHALTAGAAVPDSHRYHAVAVPVSRRAAAQSPSAQQRHSGGAAVRDWRPEMQLKLDMRNLSLRSTPSRPPGARGQVGCGDVGAVEGDSGEEQEDRPEGQEEQESGAAVCATRRGKPPRRMRGYEQPTICSAAAPLEPAAAEDAAETELGAGDGVAAAATRLDRSAAQSPKWRGPPQLGDVFERQQAKCKERDARLSRLREEAAAERRRQEEEALVSPTLQRRRHEGKVSRQQLIARLHDGAVEGANCHSRQARKELFAEEREAKEQAELAAYAEAIGDRVKVSPQLHGERLKLSTQKTQQLVGRLYPGADVAKAQRSKSKAQKKKRGAPKKPRRPKPPPVSAVWLTDHVACGVWA